VIVTKMAKRKQLAFFRRNFILNPEYFLARLGGENAT
jgi:hypothetical protein